MEPYNPGCNLNFIHCHLQNSACGFIIQKSCLDRNGIYVEMRGGCLEICKFDWGFSGFRDVERTSCNGLVLDLDYMDLHIFHVINPLTNPPCFHEVRCLAQLCFAFVETSMKYKAVQTCYSQPSISKLQISVLTIGVDKFWRHMDVEHLSLTSRLAFMSSTVAGAYTHWIGLTFVLTFDIETETIRRFPFPRLRNRSRKFIPMGCNLSIVCEARDFFRDV